MRINRLSIRFQLLLAVNLPADVLVRIFLVYDYQREMSPPRTPTCSTGCHINVGGVESLKSISTAEYSIDRVALRRLHCSRPSATTSTTGACAYIFICREWPVFALMQCS